MSANPAYRALRCPPAGGDDGAEGTYLDVVPGSWLETALGWPSNLQVVPEAAA
jgi:hypothetical protein